jgi:hypothetical protein
VSGLEIKHGESSMYKRSLSSLGEIVAGEEKMSQD